MCRGRVGRGPRAAIWTASWRVSRKDLAQPGAPTQAVILVHGLPESMISPDRRRVSVFAAAAGMIKLRHGVTTTGPPQAASWIAAAWVEVRKPNGTPTEAAPATAPSGGAATPT